MAARTQAHGLPALAHDERARVAEREVSENRFPGDQLLLGAQAEENPEQHGRGRSRIAAHLRETRRADERAREARRRRGRRDFRQRVGGDHLQGEAGRGRHHFLFDLGGGARTSGARAQVPGQRGAGRRQLLCGAQLGGIHRRLLLLHPQGRQMPDGPVDLFPHQYGKLRAVRAHADHRRGRRFGVLSRRLHRSQVRHQPVARRGGRAGCAGQCRHQVFDGAELVRRRRERPRRHLQFRHQARAVQGREFAHLLDPGRDRLGDHLEISELRAARRQFGRRVLFGGADQSSPAGRHRHQDDPPRQEHAQHHRQQGHLGRQLQQQLPRAGRGSRRPPRARAITRSAIRC